MKQRVKLFDLDSKLRDFDWSYEEYLSTLREDIDEYGAQKRTEALHRISKSVEKTISQSMEEPVKILISNSSSTLWTDVFEVYQSVSLKMQTVLEAKLTSNLHLRQILGSMTMNFEPLY
jgi:F0F1-type ATP synthase delta subunit